MAGVHHHAWPVFSEKAAICWLASLAHVGTTVGLPEESVGVFPFYFRCGELNRSPPCLLAHEHLLPVCCTVTRAWAIVHCALVWNQMFPGFSVHQAIVIVC